MSIILKLSDTLSLREIFLTDAVVLQELMSKIYPPVYKHLWKDRGVWYVQTVFNSQNLQKELSEKNTVYYFIQFNNEIIGILRIVNNVILKEFKNKKATKLHRIYLDPKVQNKGIGKIVLNFVIQHAIENKSELLWLEAMDTQTQALNFYKKLNFKISSNFKLQFDLMYEHLKGMHRMYRLL